tara:strand:+ start:4016 stop:4696 length:681 start_codon:yes stop_codon:yes gene_type:complete
MNFLALILILISFLISTGKAKQISNLRGFRYCQITTIKRVGFSLTAEIYSTVNQNKCPDKVWKKIEPELIKKEMNLIKVRLNGPRFFVVDSIKKNNSNSSELKSFNGLMMKKSLVLKFGFKDIVSGQNKTYVTRKIKNNSLLKFNLGSEVYELIDPKNNIFVMQSFSNQVNKDINLGNISQIGKVLNLPPKWHFRKRILKKDLIIGTRNGMTVIQDEYRNTYLKVE